MHTIFVLAALLLAAPATPSTPELVPLAGAVNDFNPSLTADGATLYFVRSRPDWTAPHIFVAHHTADGWSTPEPISFTDERWSDSDLGISPDGRTLYFISNRPTPSRPEHKDYDLFVATQKDGKWSEPRPLEAASSPKQEFGPDVHGDWLYFNSLREGGTGKSDIYRARLHADGTVDAPENVGTPINSALAEFDPFVTADGKRMYLSIRERPDGVGEADLYVANWDGAHWSEPRNLGAAVNSPKYDNCPFVSGDGKTLWFSSTRDGASRIYRVPIE